MFNARTAVQGLNGRTYANATALRAALGRVVWNNRSKLPADFGARDLAEIVQQQGWYEKNASGKLVVRLK